MARHRNVRSLRYADEYDGYDDVYGHSLEEETCLSPGEASRWMFDRNRETLASYYEEPEPQDDAATVRPALDDAQHAKLVACLEEVRDVLGDSVPEDVVVAAIVANEFDAQRSLDALLDADKPKPAAPRHDDEPRAKFVPPERERPDPPSVVKVVATLPHLIKTFKLDDEESSPQPGRTTPTPQQQQTPKPTETVEERAPRRRDELALYASERGSEKRHLNVVVIGHVDAGKSTLTGRLLCDLGEVSRRVLHKYEQESKKLGKQSFVYAWVLDETGEERLRGITMDVGRVQFETRTKRLTVLDAPGHADFIPNMIAGAGQADVALLVVDATRGEFESGFDSGGQTREHALLARSLGIARLAVAVNKLDTADWSELRFDEICSKLRTFLKQAGFKDGDVTYVPLSGLTGENLATKPTAGKLAEWYRGPCLLDVIDAFEPPERPVTKPFRMSVNDTFKGAGSGFCIFGKIETGALSCGDRVLVCPTKESATVKTIMMNDVHQTVSFAGDQVSVTLLGIDPQNVCVGYILCDPSKPVPIASVFEARIVVFNVKVPITNGYQVVIHHQSLTESANIIKLKASINKSTGEIIKKKPRCLCNNSVAIVEIEVCRPICIEVYKDIKELGRIMLRVGGVTIAAGLITAIVK